jgi:hypothetical protein
LDTFSSNLGLTISAKDVAEPRLDRELPGYASTLLFEEIALALQLLQPKA